MAVREAATAIGGAGNTSGEPFEIKDYTQAIHEATNLVRESRTSLESGTALLDHAAWRFAQILILTAVLVTLSTALLLWLGRRGRSRT